jgi:hypothetical protein
LLNDFSQQGLVGKIRDDCFIFYQTNLIFSMGLVGGPIVVCLLYGLFRWPSRPRAERSFWLAMIPFCVIVGIAVVGERDALGVAHLTLLPLEILGLSLLAAIAPWRRTLWILIIAGCLVDFSAGVFLQAHVESFENDSHGSVFAGLSNAGGAQSFTTPTPDSLSGTAWDNWFLKHKYALNLQKLDELSRSHPPNATIVRAQAQKTLQEDDASWRGWFGRHNGTVEFLGDQIAAMSEWGATVLAGTLMFLMLGLVRAMLQFKPVPSLNAITDDPHRQASRYKPATRPTSYARG